MSLKVGALLIFLVSVSSAAAEVVWTVATRPYLIARSSEPESDASLRALCRNPDAIELRLAAREGVGKGRGEPVTLRFQSAGHIAVVNGVSRRSEDFQMTGGTELVTDAKSGDAFFQVLSSGQAVTLSGSIKSTATWDAVGISTSVKSFLSACSGS
jgi:hypothetical protein